jgi:L-ascorbate metabolism protein UlaG (beta-lactamase superfamily)
MTAVESKMNSDQNRRHPRIRYVSGPTALLEVGGLRLLTDPTFDPPGDHPVGSRVLVKTSGPAVAPEALGPVDAVLLSHDHHPDNLDTLGREYLTTVPLVLSTTSAQARLGGMVRALPNWERTELPCPDGRGLRVTGVPAQHGPDGTEGIVGEVTGFVLEGGDLPRIYVSGDNASLNVVQAVGDRLGPVDVAILFAGAAQTALVPGAYLTLTSEGAARAAEILGARAVVPLHFEGWTHFTQGRDTLVSAFDRAGLAHRLHLPEPGGAWPESASPFASRAREGGNDVHASTR